MGTRAATRRGRLKIGTDTQTSYFFMLNCLLHSRVHTGIESNSDYYDEDVNVYLANLLNSHIDPNCLCEPSEHIAPSDADLFRKVEASRDPRYKYAVYKANADFTLMGITIFQMFESRSRNLPPIFRTPTRVHVGKAATYYELASSYATQLGPKNRAAAAILHKLAIGIDNYVKILSYMRGRYLDFISRYTPGELFHLELAIREVERQELIERRRNEFLETYYAWLKKRSEDLRARLINQATELKDLDPDFDFTLPP